MSVRGAAVDPSREVLKTLSGPGARLSRRRESEMLAKRFKTAISAVRLGSHWSSRCSVRRVVSRWTAECKRLFTVPTGIPSTSAASRYFIPW